MLQGLRNGCKLCHCLEQRVKVTKQVAHQAVGHIAVEVRVTIDKFPETEFVIVKGIDQFPHCLDAFAHLCSVIAEP